MPTAVSYRHSSEVLLATGSRTFARRKRVVEEVTFPTAGRSRFWNYYFGTSVSRRRTSSAASANSQFRNVVILGSIDVALGHTIQ